LLALLGDRRLGETEGHVVDRDSLCTRHALQDDLYSFQRTMHWHAANDRLAPYAVEKDDRVLAFDWTARSARKLSMTCGPAL
jgi:hypothetical protein